MSFTTRQWLVILVLIIGFAVAAVVARGDGGGNERRLPDVDTAAWCEGAEALVDTGGLFTGETESADAADLNALRAAIFDVEVLAPYSIRPGLARLGDLALITEQRLGELPWPAALEAAREGVDEPVVDQAIDDLDTEMRVCGLDLFA